MIKSWKKILSVIMVIGMIIPANAMPFSTASVTQTTDKVNKTVSTESESSSENHAGEYMVIGESTDNGAVYVDTPYVQTGYHNEGEEVHVLLTPKTGYKVSTFYVKDADTGDVLNQYDASDTEYLFNMPAADIILGADYEEAYDIEDTEDTSEGNDDEYSEETEAASENDAESKDISEGDNVSENDIIEPEVVQDNKNGENSDKSVLYFDVDFSSCKLILTTDDSSLIRKEDKVVDSFGSVYMLSFDNELDTEYAYNYYQYQTENVTVEIDNPISIDKKKNSQDSDIEDEEVITNLNDMVSEDTPDVGTATDASLYTVAVIDTGAEKGLDKVEYASMFGDEGYDENGHGTDMINSMLSVNPDMNILSIKALDKNGNGSIASIYSAIEYAISRKVDVINLSVSTNVPVYSTALIDVINRAGENNIAVVVSAGNQNNDVYYYTPANVDIAFTIGACNDKGERIDISNYGRDIDYYVAADSTSEASAKFVGYITKLGSDGVDQMVDKGEIFSQKTVEEKEELLYAEDAIRAENEKATVSTTASDRPSNLPATVTVDIGNIAYLGRTTFEKNSGDAYNSYPGMIIQKGLGDSVWRGSFGWDNLGIEGLDWSKIEWAADTMYGMCQNPGAPAPSYYGLGKKTFTYVEGSYTATGNSYGAYTYEVQSNTGVQNVLLEVHAAPTSTPTSGWKYIDLQKAMITNSDFQPSMNGATYLVEVRACKNKNSGNITIGEGGNYTSYGHRVLRLFATFDSTGKMIQSKDAHLKAYTNAKNGNTYPDISSIADGKILVMDAGGATSHLTNSNTQAKKLTDDNPQVGHWIDTYNLNLTTLTDNASDNEYGLYESLDGSGYKVNRYLPTIAKVDGQRMIRFRSYGGSDDEDEFYWMIIHREDKTDSSGNYLLNEGLPEMYVLDSKYEHVKGTSSSSVDKNGDGAVSKSRLLGESLAPDLYAQVFVTKKVVDAKGNEKKNVNLAGAKFAVYNNPTDARSDNNRLKSHYSNSSHSPHDLIITTDSHGFGGVTINMLDIPEVKDMYQAMIDRAKATGEPIKTEELTGLEGNVYIREINPLTGCLLNNEVYEVKVSHPNYIYKAGGKDYSYVFNAHYYVNKLLSLGYTYSANITSDDYSATKKKIDFDNGTHFSANAAFDHYLAVGKANGIQANPMYQPDYLSAGSYSDRVDSYLNWRMDDGQICCDYTALSDNTYLTINSYGTYPQAIVQSVSNVDIEGAAYVKKTSAKSDITTGNPNYSLSGAKFDVYTDKNDTLGTKITTLTTDASGKTGVVDVSDYMKLTDDKTQIMPTAFWLKETQAPKGYKISNPVQGKREVGFDNTLSNPAEWEWEDLPIHDPVNITLTKEGTGGKKLSGAVFTMNFYAVNYDSYNSYDSVKNLTPTKTWTFTTNNEGKINFRDDTPTSGTTYKGEDGKNAYPLGVYTITETTAPSGYTLGGKMLFDNDAKSEVSFNNGDNGLFFKITAIADGVGYTAKIVDANGVQIASSSANNKITSTDKPKMFGFTMTKLDADLEKNEFQGNAKNLVATFEILNNDTEVLWIDKNLNGEEDDGEAIQPGKTTSVIFTTTADGKYHTPNNQYLQTGKWVIVEKTGPEGYLVSSTRNGNPSHEIDGTNLANNSLYDVNANNGIKAIKDPVKRGGFAMVKVDADREAKDDLTVESKPQGDAELEAEFEIINNSDHKVVVPYDGTTYDIGATILTFKTTKKQINGHYYYEYHTDDINLLPYGTYIIREKTAGTGYFKDATDAADSGRESQAKSEFEFTISEESQYHIIGNTEGTNDASETQKSGSDYVTDIKAITDADIYELHSENAFVNVVKRGKAVIKKNDGDRWTHYSDNQNTFESRLGQGDAVLANATYDIINSSKYSVLIDKDNDGKYETEVQPGKVVYTLTTDATGYAETPDDFLPYGTYTIKETKAPKGYNLLNKHGITADVTAANATISNPDNKTLTVSQITDKIDDENDVINCEYKHADKTKINDTNYNHTFYNDVIRAGIRMKKNDADRKDHLSSKQGDYFLTKDYESRKEQGDASLDGAVYQIINQSKSYVWVDTNNNGTFEDTEIYQPGDVVYEMTTHYDETYGHGYASTPNNAFLPYGTYDIVEKTPSEGYLNSTIRGGVTKRTVVVTEEGTWYDLMYHAYDASLSDEENSEQTTSDIDHTFFEPIMRAGFKFDKRDEETGKTVPLGSANLEGTYKVINLSASYVWVDVGNGKDNDGDGQIDHYGNPDGIYSDDEIFWPGEIIYTFKTDKHDGHYETPNNQYLPYGTYKIQEIDPPMGYLMLSDKNPSLSLTFEVREEDKQYDLTQKIYNYAVRGDLWFNKRDGNTSKVMAYIPFKITSLDQDGNEIESHIVYTDKNGYFNSSSSYVRHGWKTNAGDQGYADYMAYYEEHGVWPEDDGVVIEGTQGHSGTWFGVDTKPVQVDESYQDYIDAFNQNKEYPNDGSLDIKDSIRLEQTGAFPYGTYLIEELPCKSNEGFVMYKDSFVIDFESASDKTTAMDPHGWYAGRDSGCFDYGNIDNFDVPTIETIALAQDTESHMTPAYKDLVIIDDVSLHHLVKDTDYTLKTTLWTADDAVPEQLKDENGEPIIVEKKIHPTSQEHFAKVNIEFDATPYKGKTIVVFEELYDAEGNLVASHTDVTDKEQQIGISGIETELSQNGKHLVKAEKNVTLVDKVKYMNLEPGKTVKLTDYLIDKDTLDYALDDNGNKIKAETTFKVDESGFGEAEVEFTFDAETLEGKTLVAFAEVTNNRKNNPTYYADHMDIEDAAQTIKFPKLGTTAFDEETGVQMSFADDHITVVDTCAYSNVFENSKLIIKGKLVNKETGNVITVDGKEVTAETEVFTSTGESGTADVTFEFDGTGLEGTTLVAYETLYIVEPDETEGAEEGATVEREIADHSNPNDAAETIYIPQVKTTAISDDTQLNVAYAGNVVNLTDKVECKNIIPELDYTLEGVLMDQTTGTEIKDANGNAITATLDFKATSADDIQNMPFTFDASGMKGKSVVVFETLYLNKKTTDESGKETVTKVLVAEHKDINDEGQTIHFPEIGTNAFDAESHLHITKAGKATIIDTVDYHNLVSGVESTIKGQLVNKETNEILTDAEGNPITAEAVFTPDKADGKADVKFEFDASNLSGTAYVGFEELYVNGSLIAEHKDIDDEAQTFYIPKIGTTLTNGSNNIHMALADSTVTLNDTVSYESVLPSQKFVMKGWLVDKSTGERVPLTEKTDITIDTHTTTDAVEEHTETDAHTSGDAVPVDREENVAYVTFTAETKDGTVVVPFTFSTTGMEGKSVVAYEELYAVDEDGREWLVSEHKDINDEGQTIHIPKIGTTAINKETSTHYAGAGKIVITDTVKFDNIIPNIEYTLVGKLMNQETNKPVKRGDGSEVMAQATFTPETASGETTIEFTFYTDNEIGNSLVAFEEVYVGTDLVGQHKDINDESQTIHVVEIKTSMIDSKTNIKTTADGKTVLVDTVSYKGLISGVPFVMSGKLMDKATGAALTKGGNGADIKTLINGITGKSNEYISEVAFTPEKSEGTVELSFEIDTSDLDGKTIVAYEKLYSEDKEIAKHEDINDLDQSVYVVKIGTTASSKDDKDELEVAKDTVLKDVIAFENLTKDTEYTIKGEIYDKSTGKSTGIKADSKFTPKDSKGETTMNFTIDTTKYAGKELVVFEYIYYKDVLVASHTDINSKSQTVTVKKPKDETTTEEKTTEQKTTETPKTPSTPNTDTSTKTNDMILVYIILGIIIVSAGGVAVYYGFKRRKIK